LAAESVELKEASGLEIVSLMDNTADFLSSNNRKEVRSFRYWTQRYAELPIAEHGFSMLVRVFNGEDSCTILFDTGVSPDGVVVNAKRMGIDLNEVSYIALSHGHYDHFGGLEAIAKAINKPDLPIIIHEDMIKRRGTANSKREIREYTTFPSLEELAPKKIIKTKKPQLIASDYACLTGEIPRAVSFEEGLTQNMIYRDNAWQPDLLILDERALIFNVNKKGLVIISGCAHAGIINTIKYAQQISGCTRIYAILGGFHLAGREFEKRIAPTMKELTVIKPEVIVPSHCTGWRAAVSIAKEFPNNFVSNSVGNIYKFGQSQ
jgi:7,8-dihydropterin-6-yl-methyl-4-(beta-D-ribofuranosyl)aminobenzene 5'-phosphate synthase